MNQDLNVKIRNVTEEDLDEIVRINNQFEGRVTIRSKDFFQNLLRIYRNFYAATYDGKIIGYLTVMDENTNYSSELFDWFKKRFNHFLYIDQIAVDKSFHKKGIGRRLYQHLIKNSSLDYSTVYSDLFLKPRNETSYQFHERLGFKQIGTLELKNGRIAGMFELKLNSV